jgi:hypothetical protein
VLAAAAVGVADVLFLSASSVTCQPSLTRHHDTRHATPRHTTRHLNKMETASTYEIESSRRLCRRTGMLVSEVAITLCGRGGQTRQEGLMGGGEGMPHLPSTGLQSPHLLLEHIHLQSQLVRFVLYAKRGARVRWRKALMRRRP